MALIVSRVKLMLADGKTLCRWISKREAEQMLKSGLVARLGKKTQYSVRMRDLPMPSTALASMCMPTAAECRRYAELRADDRTVPEELEAKVDACQPKFYGVYMDLRELAAA